MRLAIGWLLLVVGCGGGGGSTAPDARASPDAPPDASGPDANFEYCTAAAGTADVTATGGAPSTFSRLHAGGIWNTGPVAPDTAAFGELSVMLLFTTADLLPTQLGWCCSAGAQSTCCTLDGLVVVSQPFAPSAALGTHPVKIESFRDASFSLSGNLTITGFTQPLEYAPGQIAGSISASAGGSTVTGTFDNVFCATLLAGTI